MKKSTRYVTLSALLCALVFVSVFTASLWPTGQLAIIAFASLFIAAAVIEMGIAQGLQVYVVSSLLCLLILPNKVDALLHIIFFGYYPIVKSLVERRRNTIVQWVLKLLVFNAALFAALFFFSEVFIFPGSIAPAQWIIYTCGSAIFAFYDYGYTKLIWLYMYRVHSKANLRTSSQWNGKD